MPPELHSSPHTASEISDLRASVRLWWSIAVGVLGAFNLYVILFTIPKFQKIFDDMIPGGAAKLPVLTQMIIMWSRTAPACLLAELLLIAVGLVPLWRMKSMLIGSITAAFVVALLATQIVITLMALYLPLMTVIQNLSVA